MKKKLQLILMVGVSGSGKSTWSNTLVGPLNAVKVETDRIRFELMGDESNQTQNRQVFDIAKQRIRSNLSSGINVIFDATNLSIKDRQDFIDIGKEYNAEISAYVCKPDLLISKQRNNLRDRKVPLEVIENQNKKFVMPTHGEGFSNIQVSTS